MDLYNTENAFRGKSAKQLRQSNRLFSLMRSPFLVNIFSQLAVLAIRMGLPVKGIIRRTIFRQFCGGESIDECKPVLKDLQAQGIGSILDYSIEGKEREEDFEKVKNEVIRIIGLAASDRSIPYTSIKLTGIMPSSVLEEYRRGQTATDELTQRSVNRLDAICREASEKGVPVYFDAEESWIQDGIDALAEEMMLKYNRQAPIVLTTLQMYRHDRYAYLLRLLEMARSEKIQVGIKLVRGAYWEKENRRAKENGYPSPVHQDKLHTDRDFDRAVDTCLRNIDIVLLCAGTHNEASTLYLVRRMQELGIPPAHPHVYFSQLYGMSDHISFNLAKEGYRVTKYLPYGPVKSVIPYLIRRAEENTAIAGQMSRELNLIREELTRRKEQKLLT